MKLSNVFSDFKKTNTQCELCRTLEFIIGKTTYRVDVLYCYSNPKSPWSAQAFSERRDAFPRVAPFGIRLSTPRRIRVRIAVQNIYAVGSFTNYKFQCSAKLTLRMSLFEVGKDI